MATPVPSSRPDRSWDAIYRAVRRVPRGRVATYGLIAMVAGRPGHARQVGYALHALPAGSDVPWHRVVNARGEISLRTAGGHDELQRVLLEAEGVTFSVRGRIDLARFLWRPRLPSPAPRRRSR